jgi:hypothetical protein
MKSKTFQNDTLRIKPFVLLLILAGITAACNTLPAVQQSRNIPIKELPFPAADYDLINMVDHKLTGWVVGKYPGNQPLRNQWSYANEGDIELRQIVFAKDPACAMGMVYYVGEILPDGRLQLFKLCAIGDAESLSGMRTLTYLMAYDWQTGAMEQMAGPIPL